MRYGQRGIEARAPLGANGDKYQALDFASLMAPPRFSSVEPSVERPFQGESGSRDGSALYGPKVCLSYTAAISRTSVSRMRLPDGSRKDEEIPKGRSEGSSLNSTPRRLSSS